MRRQRTRDTGPEMALRRELHRRGLRYRVDRRVLPATTRRSDIVFVGARVVVDVRGCYWHGCQEHGSLPTANSEWWTAKIATTRLRDEDTELRLREAGWDVIVVWEHDDPQAVAAAIEARVKGTTAVASTTPRTEGLA